MGGAFRVEGEGSIYHITRAGKERRHFPLSVQCFSEMAEMEAGSLFGGTHYTAASKASWKLKEQSTCDKKLTDLVDDIISQIKT